MGVEALAAGIIWPVTHTGFGASLSRLAPQSLIPSILCVADHSGRVAFGWMNYVTLSIYLALILVIGLHFAGREKSTDDFCLGGRRVRWWAAGLSIFGTQLSAITFMAIPAKAYGTNWSYIFNHVTIVMVAPIVVFFYLPFFRRLRLTTAYEYLEMRFNVTVRLFGAVLFCLMQVGRMGIVLYLPAIALSTVTDLNVYVCILIMGALCTVYTAFGGIEAVIWTDVVQVVVLLGGALLCIGAVALRVNGGILGIIDTGLQAGKFNLLNPSWSYTTASVWVIFAGTLFSNLVPYSADQTVIQRYLTTPTEKQAARAIWTNAALTMPSAFIFFFLGTALYVFYTVQANKPDPNLRADAILPWFIVHELPPGVAGIVVAAIFAAAMSSLDSSMNSMATVLVTDFYGRIKPDSSDRARLLLVRVFTVLLGAFGTGCAVFMASVEIESLWDLFLALLGMLGGGLAGVFALGIFTRRANGTGALLGIICSTAVLYLVKQHTQTHFLLYGAIGITTCIAVGYIAALAMGSKPCPRELTVYGIRGKNEHSL
jgi:SSS family solute:Na+ symporter